LLAACGDDGASEQPAATETEPAGPAIEVDGVWARTSPAVATAGAVYFTVTNLGDVDDALVGASVDPSVAAMVELHETAAADDAMGESAGEDTTTTMAGTGMMEMRPVDRIDVPAGETVALEPGGYHVMLLDLAEPLVVGNTIDVTLSFEQFGEQVVTAEIRDTPAMP
jgi:copper(I)-binding protein